jgi:hypothetical protein
MAVSIVLFVSGLCAAQGNLQPTDLTSTINLTGTWTLDLKASDFGGAKSFLIYDSLALVISHSGPVLKITRKMTKKNKTTTQELTYYTDGRGETNPTGNENGRLQSKTSWSDKLITIQGTSETPMGGDVVISDVNGKWELSDSGNTLIEYTVSGPFRSKFGNTPSFGANKVTKVFRRQR